MEKLKLENVTILGIDCVNVDRLISAMNTSEKNIEFGDSVILTSLPTNDPRAIKIPHINSIEDFSDFCIKELTKYVKTDYVLLIQYDGFVIDHTKWTDEFFKYDYIGGPISTKSWKDKNPETPDLIMGNGGFCLRSKKLLNLCSQLAFDGTIKRTHPEDTVICVDYRDLLEKNGIVFGPNDLAIKFSVQYDYDGFPYEIPFGFHGMYGKNLEVISEKHPEFPLLFFMQRIRRGRVLRIRDAFEKRALFGYTFGSTAKNKLDTFSDINIFISVDDLEFPNVIKDRFKIYEQIGYEPEEIIHIFESKQENPNDPIKSFVLYKTKIGLLGVDFNIYPKSKSFILNEHKVIFGEINDFPYKENILDFKIEETSKENILDFFIYSIFKTIKILAREPNNEIKNLILDYKTLNIFFPDLKEISNEKSFDKLKEIINNIKDISNQKQINTLEDINSFIIQVQKFFSYSSQ